MRQTEVQLVSSGVTLEKVRGQDKAVSHLHGMLEDLRLWQSGRLSAERIASALRLRQNDEKGSKPIMYRLALTALLALTLLAGCFPVSGSRVTVERAEPDELLKLRAGPGLGFRVIVGLPDGTELIQRDCVTEAGQRWCRVSLADAPTLTGYVAADYLSSF